MVDSSLSVVIQQYVEDAAVLHGVRTSLTQAPHVKLHRIRRFDDRLLAHLDGLSIAGEQGWPAVDAALANPSRGAVFTATVAALESRSATRLNRLYALAEAQPESQPGLFSAFGWVRQDQLRGVVNILLSSPNPFSRLIGFVACSLHRVFPDTARDVLTKNSEVVPAVRARAVRAAGEMGRVDLSAACIEMLRSDEPECRFWASWSAVLLGNRGIGLQTIQSIGLTSGPCQARAINLSIQASNQSDARQWLQRLALQTVHLRHLIRGSGIAGDPAYVPWLIQHMSDKKTARVAGEAFSLITGLDLAYLNLETKPPDDGSDGGPNDDPADSNVEMDEDNGLPWPDPHRISHWWESNGRRFEAGMRYFLGEAVSRENCLRVLRDGFQRQRILAAHYLCLLEPGTVLFEWRAPAFRQQRLLAAMS